DPIIGAFTRDGSHVVVFESQWRIALFETQSGRRILNDPSAMSVMLDSAGDTLATFGLDGVVRLWRGTDGALTAHVPVANTRDPAYGDLSPDGAFVVTVGETDAGLWSALDGHLLARLPMHRDLLLWQYPSQAGRDLGLADPSRDMAARLGIPSFVHGGRSVVTLDDGPQPALVAWSVPLEERQSAEISASMESNVPWRVPGARLVPVLGSVRGRVVHAGKTVPAALVLAQDANDRDPISMRANSAVARLDGTFVLRDLHPGAYDLVAGAAG